jgi:hypothetical protein
MSTGQFGAFCLRARVNDIQRGGKPWEIDASIFTMEKPFNSTLAL